VQKRPASPGSVQRKRFRTKAPPEGSPTKPPGKCRSGEEEGVHEEAKKDKEKKQKKAEEEEEIQDGGEEADEAQAKYTMPWLKSLGLHDPQVRLLYYAKCCSSRGFDLDPFVFRRLPPHAADPRKGKW